MHLTAHGLMKLVILRSWPLTKVSSVVIQCSRVLEMSQTCLSLSGLVSSMFAADGTFQAPTSELFRSPGLLNVADPMANIATTVSPTTTAATTAMSGSSSLLHPLTQGTVDISP